MSIYSQIIEKVKARLDILDTLAEVNKTLRKRPAFVPMQDTLPQIVVAPRADLCERVGDLYFGGTTLIFDVYVGLIVDERWDEDHYFERLDWREAIRRDLWEPLRLDLASIGEVDVLYDPAPVGVDDVPPNTEGGWQLFSYVISTTRASS